MSVSWFAFTLLSAIVITMLNYRAFEYVYNNLSSSNFLATLLLVVAYFCLVYIIFALLFVKYLTKFFMIIFLGVSLISLYFNYFYGVLIDSDMIKNAIETDSKEVLELLNWRLIAVFLLTIVFGWLIAKINIVYAPLKRQILFRTSSIAVAWYCLWLVFCLLPKLMFHFSAHTIKFDFIIRPFINFMPCSDITKKI